MFFITTVCYNQVVIFGKISIRIGKEKNIGFFVSSFLS